MSMMRMMSFPSVLLERWQRMRLPWHFQYRPLHRPRQLLLVLRLQLSQPPPSSCSSYPFSPYRRCHSRPQAGEPHTPA